MEGCITLNQHFTLPLENIETTIDTLFEKNHTLQRFTELCTKILAIFIKLHNSEQVTFLISPPYIKISSSTWNTSYCIESRRITEVHLILSNFSLFYERLFISIQALFPSDPNTSINTAAMITSHPLSIRFTSCLLTKSGQTLYFFGKSPSPHGTLLSFNFLPKKD